MGADGSGWKRTSISRGALKIQSHYGGKRRRADSSGLGDGGEGGIRTHGTVARTSVFETDPIDRSGTSPQALGPRGIRERPARRNAAVPVDHLATARLYP